MGFDTPGAALDPTLSAGLSLEFAVSEFGVAGKDDGVENERYLRSPPR